MSYGLMICSICHHEVHQSGQNYSWCHCETGLPLCNDGHSIYAEKVSDIVGDWCGADDLDRVFPRGVKR